MTTVGAKHCFLLVSNGQLQPGCHSNTTENITRQTYSNTAYNITDCVKPYLK